MTRTELQQLARRFYDDAMQTSARMAPTGEDIDEVRDVSHVRAALEQFVEDVDNANPGTQNTIVVRRLIKRVLEVDMNVPANRKGGIPAALNLVSRVNPKTNALHRAIYRMMDELLPTAPSQEDCVRRVIGAFHETGIKTNLTEKGVMKIYERWSNAGSEGPPPRSK